MSERDNWASMAVIYQRCAAESFAKAAYFRDRGELKRWAYHQRQAARDASEARRYLFGALQRPR